MTTTPQHPAPARWAVLAAHAVALLTLPTGLWRLLLAAGQPAGYTEAGYEAMGVDGWGVVYVTVSYYRRRRPAVAGSGGRRSRSSRVPARDGCP
ncbi:hypothetical protein ACIQ1J_09440 [Streptomyces sp. NPDC097107]|uniref:hypothetical protein n=1 Tax=Streptomyces sp. NPDC097107 TaxID=3366089 RepID=UPI003821B235